MLQTFGKFFHEEGSEVSSYNQFSTIFIITRFKFNILMFPFTHKGQVAGIAGFCYVSSGLAVS